MSQSFRTLLLPLSLLSCVTHVLCVSMNANREKEPSEEEEGVRRMRGAFDWQVCFTGGKFRAIMQIRMHVKGEEKERMREQSDVPYY